jgi:hypothetical protein
MRYDDDQSKNGILMPPFGICPLTPYDCIARSLFWGRHIASSIRCFGRPGERLVGYDNERGKGDHRHYGLRETSYDFVSIEQLMEDFGADISRVRGSLW